MAVQLLIEKARACAEGVFEANVDPADLEAVGRALEHKGDVSVVLLTDQFSHDVDSSSLKFALGSAVLLNSGRAARTLFIAGSLGEASQHDVQVRPQHEQGGRGADRQFLEELDQLSPELIATGRELLARVRSEFGGFFETSQSGRYINKPDNFWTVKVQPRDVSLAVTVRGEPQRFGRVDQINLKADRTGYARFKVERPDQLDEAWRVISAAGRG